MPPRAPGPPDDVFLVPVVTECGTCASVVACQWDGVDGNWFCRGCWLEIGGRGPDPSWPDATVVCTRDQAHAAEATRAWRAGLDDDDAEALPVGFDVEWKPNYVRGEPPNRVALLQLHARGLSVLTRLVGHATLHADILALMTHPNVILVGVGVKQDVRKLARDFPGGGGGDAAATTTTTKTTTTTTTVRVAELADVARRLGHEGGCGLKALALANDVSTSHKTKRLTMTNWEKPTLSPPEVRYGSQDASLGVDVAEKLRRVNTRSSRSLVPARPRSRLSARPSLSTPRDSD